MLNEIGSQIGHEAGKIGAEILRQKIVQTGLGQDLQASESVLSGIAAERIAQKRVLLKFARGNYAWRLLKFKQQRPMRIGLGLGTGIAIVLLCSLLKGHGKRKPEFSKPVPIS